MEDWKNGSPAPPGGKYQIPRFPDIFIPKFIPKTPSTSTLNLNESQSDTKEDVVDKEDDPLDYLNIPDTQEVQLPTFLAEVEKTLFDLSVGAGSLTTPSTQWGQGSLDQLTNSTSASILVEMPLEFREMSQSTLNSVIAYCVLFAVAFIGNLTVFFKVLKEYRKQRGRIPLLILHLSVADLIVCSCLIPIEVTWRITIQWYGGNALCKICMFMRAFGLYLSSMVLICVSMDRFWAIVYPLKCIEGRRRVKVMLGMAWIAAMVFSIPQVIFFNVVSHPLFPSFRQCVTSSFLLDPEDAKLYSIFSVSAMYFAPLGVIIFTYSRILVKMIRKSRESAGTLPIRRRRPLRTMSERHLRRAGPGNESWRRLRLSLRAKPSRSSPATSQEGKTDSTFETGDPVKRSLRDSEEVDGKAQLILRMSGNAVLNISRARDRTLRMTIVIVLVFVFCWTPYVVMTLWYVFDWQGAKRVDPKIQEGLFLMAVANSCVNPLVYGSFSRNSCGLSKVLTCKRQNTTGRFS